jgi:hypothetical protein
LPLDENIYELRREKLKKIEALGHPAYPRKCNFSMPFGGFWRSGG